MGDEIDDPRSGQRLVFHPTGGDILEVDLFVRPGAFVREHVHPAQEETFTAVAGTFELDLDGEKRRLQPGESIVIPERTRHGFEAAAAEAHLRVTVRPALDLAGYFRAFLSLSREDRLRIPPRGLPKPLLLFAVLMHRYRREIAAAGIPIWLQRPLWRVLALLGRLRGHRVD
jgi:quercetin dioxygenase-like cupin family protein